MDSAIDVLTGRYSLAIEKDNTQFEKPTNAFGDISAVMMIKTPQHLGSLSISFPEEVYLEMISSEEEAEEELTRENCVQAENICRQIFLLAHSKLHKKGISL